MRYRRLSLKPILSTELPAPVLVLCRNLKYIHNHLYLRYIYWGYGFSLDDPTFDESVEIVRELKIRLKDWIIIESDCPSCQMAQKLLNS